MFLSLCSRVRPGVAYAHHRLMLPTVWGGYNKLPYIEITSVLLTQTRAVITAVCRKTWVCRLLLDFSKDGSRNARTGATWRAMLADGQTQPDTSELLVQVMQ